MFYFKQHMPEQLSIYAIQRQFFINIALKKIYNSSYFHAVTTCNNKTQDMQVRTIISVIRSLMAKILTAE